MSKQKLVLVTPQAAPQDAEKAAGRSSIAKVAASKDKPATPFDVRSEKVRGLLLRVESSGNRSFYVQIGRGKRVRIGPAGTFTLAQAEQRAREILVDPEAHMRKRAEAVTLREYIDQTYAPHAEARLATGKALVARVKASWGPLLSKRIADIKLRDIDAVKTKRLVAGIARSTVNRDTRALSGVLTHWSEGSGAANVLHGADDLEEADDQRVRYLSRDEEHRLRKALTDRDARIAEERRSANAWRAERGYEPMAEISGYGDHLTPMVLLSLNTGMRRGELFGLTWEAVDFNTRTLTVLARTSKGRKTRPIPLNAEALVVLTTIKPEKAAGLVFKSPKTGGRFDNVKKAWAEITERAKLPDFRWHDMRHDFASKLVMRGVPIYSVQKLLGHGSPLMTQRYAKLAPGALADAVAVLGVPA